MRRPRRLFFVTDQHQWLLEAFRVCHCQARRGRRGNVCQHADALAMHPASTASSEHCGAVVLYWASAYGAVVLRRSI